MTVHNLNMVKITDQIGDLFENLDPISDKINKAKENVKGVVVRALTEGNVRPGVRHVINANNWTISQVFVVPESALNPIRARDTRLSLELVLRMGTKGKR